MEDESSSDSEEVVEPEPLEEWVVLQSKRKKDAAEEEGGTMQSIAQRELTGMWMMQDVVCCLLFLQDVGRNLYLLSAIFRIVCLRDHLQMLGISTRSLLKLG
jgi:hypothetical protein